MSDQNVVPIESKQVRRLSYAAQFDGSNLLCWLFGHKGMVITQNQNPTRYTIVCCRCGKRKTHGINVTHDVTNLRLYSSRSP